MRQSLAAGRCVVLDGATGTQLVDAAGGGLDERSWALERDGTSRATVRAVHESYVAAGCDVLSTHTWGMASVARKAWSPSPGRLRSGRSTAHWADTARAGVELAREAAHASGRAEGVAVAFSVNADIDTDDDMPRVLARVLRSDPPDLVLLETLSLVRPSTLKAVATLLDTGIPLWMSFRRCRHGVCGVHGEHWGGPEGDAFGRTAHELEQLGVDALLVNCIPPDHVQGMVSWLRHFVDVPLGVYPNLGYMTSAGWQTEDAVTPTRYAELAAEWREEGAQIIGGCCGVGPAHMAAVVRAVEGAPVGHRHRAPATESTAEWREDIEPLSDRRGRTVYPLPFPDVSVDAGVDPPGTDSLLLWKLLQRQGIGAHLRCLDVGSGAGLLTVQLALNGAQHVHALGQDAAATSNTLVNAFRNAVATRVTSETVDLYPWLPAEAYDVVVACLTQEPTDPLTRLTAHRAADYWGRNLFDRLVDLLPAALAEGGVAYVVQRSVLGQQETLAHLAACGLSARVVDFDFAALADVPDHLLDVEERSDAYHLQLGGASFAVDYLLEIRRADQTP